MKFTVLIPLYNKAHYIRNTIASVLAQSFTDFEILVIDDGSTDVGAQVVKDFSNDRIRLIHQVNAGVSAARNRGITEARGDWVAFLDADDLQHPDFLAALVRAQRACPEAGAVATDFLRFPHTEGAWPVRWPILNGEPEIELIVDLPTRWMRGPSLCSSSVAVRRDWLQAMQPCFPVGESVGEDLDLWFRLSAKTPIALVCAQLVAYRELVPGSLSSQHNISNVPPFFDRIRKRALSGQMTTAQRRSALWLVAQHEVTLARMAVTEGNRKLGLRWLIRGRHAALGRRWWLTLAMTLFFPDHLVSRWQAWRIQRSRPATTNQTS